ncbi:MAG: hypothetical protein WAN46_08985 [Gammaproteobacteria bacterium]
MPIICRQSIALPQGCVQQGCWTQVYKDVFTTSLEARLLVAIPTGTMTMADFFVIAGPAIGQPGIR